MANSTSRKATRNPKRETWNPELAVPRRPRLLTDPVIFEQNPATGG